jgi:DNA-binding MarR family transcriptional regulator
MPGAGKHTEPIKAGQEGVGFLVNQTSRAFQQRLAKDISQYSLSIEGYTFMRHLLRELESSPSGVSVSSLSEKLMIPVPRLNETGAILRRDGWVTTVGEGSRARYLPTPGAAKLGLVMASSSRWMLEEALNGFSRDEIDALSLALKRILKNLGAPLGEDEGPLQL